MYRAGLAIPLDMAYRTIFRSHEGTYMARPGPPKLFDEQLTVPVERDVKDRLRDLAASSDQTLSAYVRAALRERLEEDTWEHAQTR